jgi:nitric-oxide synthase
VNRAVLHSFEQAGVTISDHHSETSRFLKHLAKEEKAGRTCPADWSWVVPPMSGALTPVYHRYYDTDHLKPEFVADDEAMRTALEGVPPRGAARGTPLYSPTWTYLRTGQLNGSHAS